MVEDDESLRRILGRDLRTQRFDIDSVDTGSAALAVVETAHPDLMILDLGLPDMDGIDIIRRVRTTSSLPIIVLSGRADEREKVIALDAGADDYVAKPFSIEELHARIRVALRHLAPAEDAGGWAGEGLDIDFGSRTVSVDGTAVRLTPTEYDLLRALVAHAGQVVSDRELLQTVWGPEYTSEHHYLNVYVARLRRKFERDPRAPQFIVTEVGTGYRLAISGTADDARSRTLSRS